MAHARMVLSLALASLVLLPASESAQQGDITTIDCPGAASTFVAGINDAGRGVGVYLDVLPLALGGAHGFIWDGSGCEPIPGLPVDGIPFGLNDAEAVVGIYYVPIPSEGRGFLYRRGQMMDLLCPATETEYCAAFALGINNRGQVVGSYEEAVPHTRPFMWEDGSYVALPELPWVHTTVRATGINARGDVIGLYYGRPVAPDVTYGVLWPKDGEPVRFGFPMAGNNVLDIAMTTAPRAITAGGDMVGYFYESMFEDAEELDGVLAGPCRGFFRDRNGAIIELKVPGATYTCPGGINAAGQVSGVYTMDEPGPPFATISWRGFVAKVEALVVR
jgi:probable HAF family extracellular repeat protein